MSLRTFYVISVTLIECVIYQVKEKESLQIECDGGLERTPAWSTTF